MFPARCVPVPLRDLTRLCLLLLLVVAGATSFARAQTGLYAEFGGSKVGAPGNDWIYGPTFGAYTDFLPLPFVHLGADLRGSVFGISQTTTLYNGLIGPRLSVHPHVLPINPYVEAVFGVGHFDYGRGAGSDSKFEYQFLGGIDHTLVPRVDWRVIEFSYGHLSALDSSLNPKTISTGLVLRLP